MRLFVDARDSEGRWFDSVVVEVDGSKVKVHFRGWSSRWDTWVEKEDQSSLQPLFARTKDLRGRVRLGDACRAEMARAAAAAAASRRRSPTRAPTRNI